MSEEFLIILLSGVLSQIDSYSKLQKKKHSLDKIVLFTFFKYCRLEIESSSNFKLFRPENGFQILTKSYLDYSSILKRLILIGQNVKRCVG